MDETARPPLPAIEKPGFFGTFFLGLRVWGREMRRILGRQARLHEARQLRKRLEEERELCARLHNAPGAERELCLRQVAMLEAELMRLAREEDARSKRSPTA